MSNSNYSISNSNMSSRYRRTFVKGRYGRYGRKPMAVSKWRYRRRIPNAPRRVVSNKRRYAKYLANMRTGGFLGIEYKFLDCTWNGVAIAESADGAGGELQPSAGCTSAISVPAQGDGESERDGRKYTLKSAWVSGVITYTGLQDQADVAQTLGFFFALVLDTQANGATIVSENVYTNPSTVAPSILPQPLRDLQQSKRYRVLASQYIPPPGAYSGSDGANTSSVVPQCAPHVNLSWKGNIVCDSSGTTASVASASDNALHVIAYAGQTAFTPVFKGKSRVRFVG